MNGDLKDARPLDGATEEFFGGCVSPHSVRRWISKGVGVPPVKLRAKRVGRKYFITRDDADEFLQAVADPALYSVHKRSERCELAKRRLQQAGA
jgi:hypothetical protein